MEDSGEEDPEKLRGEDLKLFVGVLDLDKEVLSLSSPIRLRFFKRKSNQLVLPCGNWVFYNFRKGRRFTNKDIFG